MCLHSTSVESTSCTTEPFRREPVEKKHPKLSHQWGFNPQRRHQDRSQESRSDPVTNGSLHHVWSSSRFLLISICQRIPRVKKFMSKFCRFCRFLSTFCQLFVNFLSTFCQLFVNFVDTFPVDGFPVEILSTFCRFFVDFLSTFCQLFVNSSATFSRPTFSRIKDGPSKPPKELQSFHPSTPCPAHPSIPPPPLLLIWPSPPKFIYHRTSTATPSPPPPKKKTKLASALWALLLFKISCKGSLRPGLWS